MESIKHSIYPAQSFIALLVALVTPDEASRLYDSLPFPEILGTATRFAGGIEPYIDFVMKDVMELCKRVKEVKCWGCNRVSERCSRKVWNIYIDLTLSHIFYRGMSIFTA